MMNKNKILQSKYFFGAIFFVCVLITSFLSGSYHFFNKKLAGDENIPYYRGSLIMDFDVVNVVGPRIKEVLEGNYKVSDIDIFEYKDYPVFMSPLAPIFFVPFKLFTNSISELLVLSDFIFPIFFFILLFAIYYFISEKQKWISLFFTVLSCLYPYFTIHFPPAGMNYLKIFISSLTPFGESQDIFFLLRKESFIPGLIPFLLGILFVYLSVIKKNKIFPIFGGFFYALNAYTYPYHFIYLSASLGILFIFSVFTKNKELLKKLAIVFLAALITLIPFFITQFQLRFLPQYEDILKRFGLEYGRDFRWSNWKRYLWSIILSILVWFWGKKENKRNTSYFLISFLLSTILVLNMQVFLGFSVQTDHWLNRTLLWGINLSYFVLFCYTINYFKNKFSYGKYVSIFLGLAILVSLAINSFHFSLSSAKSDYKYYTISQETADVLDWFNKNTEFNSVIMTPSLVDNYYISLYTHNRIFIPKAFTSMVPEKEAIERLYITYNLFNIDENYLDYIIGFDEEDNRNDNFDPMNLDFYEKKGILYLFCDKYTDTSLDTYVSNKNIYKTIPKWLHYEIVEDFKKYDCADSCFKKYRVDYILYGPQEKKITNINLEENRYLQKVYDKDEVEIYKVIE